MSESAGHQKTETKEVTIVLSALTRVEYTRVLTVPDGITDDQLNDLVNKVWDETDGGEFSDDTEYFERGNCRWEESNVYSLKSTGEVTISEGGGLSIQDADAEDGTLERERSQG